MDHKRCNLCFFFTFKLQTQEKLSSKKRHYSYFPGHSLPVVGQVVEATFDESHSDLSVGEPADERTQQLLCLVNQTLRQMNLQTHRQTLVHTESWSV